jgi:hypothetical protein
MTPLNSFARIAHTIAAPAAVLLALSACAPMGGVNGRASNDGHAKNVPVATPVGKPESCIPLAQIRESRVRDDWTIDFHVGGNKWYRNTLPYRCNSLGFERSFSYKTSLSQLCNVDIITVFASGGGGSGPRGSCGLGQFQPVTLAK